MKSLDINWFTEGLIDFEYKQYVLLAYLQEVKSYFEANRLYPALSDMISHYRNLKDFQESKDKLFNQFPKRLTDIDRGRFELVYQSVVQDNATLNEIDQIVDFALPKIQSSVEQGRELYDIVESKLSIQPVGLSPIYKREGYLFVRLGESADTNVYLYSVNYFTYNEEKLTGIQTQFLTTMRLSIGVSYETMKMELIRENKSLPNPATYVVETPFVWPLEETVLPVCKRTLLTKMLQNNGL